MRIKVLCLLLILSSFSILKAYGINVGEITTGTATISTALVVNGSVTGIDKSDVGLGNVDNTSDANKPISTATQNALDTKLSSENASITYLSCVTASDTYLAKNATASDSNKLGGELASYYASTTSVAGKAAVSGTEGQIQYNNGSGNLSASSNLVYDGTNTKIGGIYVKNNENTVYLADSTTPNINDGRIRYDVASRTYHFEHYDGTNWVI